MPVPRPPRRAHARQADIDPARLSEALTRRMQERGITQYDLADRLGVSQPTVSGWLRCRRKPSPANAQAALDLLELSWADVAPEAGEAAEAEPDRVAIPRAGHAAAATHASNGVVNSGGGPDAFGEPALDYYPEAELRRLTNADPARLRSAVVVGDSLMPEVPPNATVVFLPGAFHADGLHVVSIDGAEVIKRVQFRPGGALDLIPINPDYERERLLPVPEADTPNTYRSETTGLTAEIRMVGKVVFYPKPA